MCWRGKSILDISREFIDTSGPGREAEVLVGKYDLAESAYLNSLPETLEDLNCCSQRGLVEKFDSTIGAATVLAPLGGKFQLTPAPGMAAKLPVVSGETKTATLMAYGFNPGISKASPFHGAMYAVIESVTKIAAMGGDISNIRLTFQEYFEKMKGPSSWGKPFAALLGALKAQRELEIPAIGGKDSMSGTFMDMDVPPTLVSFAVAVSGADIVISPEFKRPNSKIVAVSTTHDNYGLPYFRYYRESMKKIALLIGQKKILSANTVGQGGTFISLVKMSAGNGIGFKIKKVDKEKLLKPDYTAVILEIPEDENVEKLFAGIKYEELGTTTESGVLIIDEMFSMNVKDAIAKWSAPLEGIFPCHAPGSTDETDGAPAETFSFEGRARSFPKIRTVKPRALITVFPGTNCEVDSKRAFEKAGAAVDFHIMRNLNRDVLIQSIDELAEKIRESQIIMIPGGFSSGDEPDGSAKFITAVFRNEKITEAVSDFMENRDGLMLGICNGFQALIKLGLVPYGQIVPPDEKNPTLTYNRIGRHMSRLVNVRVASVKSPWFSLASVGDIYTGPVSHGEGRFVASDAQIAGFAENGQVAAQYVDFTGKASMDIEFNPNGSSYAIEALTSPDGRILGKMVHAERVGDNTYRNVPGNYDWKIFESGVRYFNY